jgi:phospholipase/carboxylesterase
MNQSVSPSSAVDLDPIVLNPSGPTIASVIWLHGLGADGHDFEPVAQQMGLLDRGVRFVFPQAPVQPVTINGGLAMRSWYDLLGEDFWVREDEAGIRASSQAIVTLLKSEIARGVPAGRVVLAGFSQGGAITLHAGLRLPWRLAGLMALSTYLPLAASLDVEFDPVNVGLPVFSGHGSADPLIPIRLANECRERLQAKGLVLESHDYPIEHGVAMEEMLDIRVWLFQVLGLD